MTPHNVEVAQEVIDKKVSPKTVRHPEHSSKSKDEGRRMPPYQRKQSSGYTAQSDGLKEFRKSMYSYFDGLNSLVSMGKTEEVQQSLNDILSGIKIGTDKTTVEFYRIIDYLANAITPAQMLGKSAQVSRTLINLRDGFK
jgi:hypothetical protein